MIFYHLLVECFDYYFYFGGLRYNVKFSLLLFLCFSILYMSFFIIVKMNFEIINEGSIRL